MTLRELVIDVIGLDEPLAALMGAFAVLRTAIQGEAATFEGVSCSLIAWHKHYGDVTEANVLRWLDDVPTLAELEIPDGVLQEAAKALSDDEE